MMTVSKHPTRKPKISCNNGNNKADSASNKKITVAVIEDMLKKDKSVPTMEGGPSIQDVEGAEYSISTEVAPSGCMHCFTHPRGVLHRFIALFFMCLLGFGSYFCYDNPAALQNHINRDLNLTNTEYSMFYSIYSWPNVFLCFIGGFLLDRVFGIRLGTNIYMLLTLVGQILFATGGLVNYYWLMLVGRFVFGIGAESLAVAQNNYAVLWFKGKELNMVFGLQLSFARIGSTVNFLVMESIYGWVTQKYTGYEGIGVVLFLAGGTCIMSMLCSLILGLMDKRAERILRRNDNQSSEVVRLTDVKNFKSTFWLIAVICVAYYIAIFPFIGQGKNFFKERFHMEDQAANSLNSMVYLVAGVASPVFGILIDKLGKNVSWVTLAVVATITAHSLLAFTQVTPYVGMVLMGLAYSTLASSLWPLVSLIVPEYQLGTAYGVCQAVQNLGLAVFNYVAGAIVDKWGYVSMEEFFICSLVIALIATIILWILDIKTDGVLNMTPGQRSTAARAVALEEEKMLVSQESLTSSESSVDHSEGGLQPSTDFDIRNRYLSKIGAPVSEIADR